MKILEDITVVDLSKYISGPNCCELLGDLGANVIKVEPPKGSPEREYDPSLDGVSFYYMVFNRNKKGITTNTRTSGGKEILKRLIGKADVLVENYKPGTMEKMGLSYEVLHELNPKLIVASISGFGQNGPMAEKPGFDSILQAMSGLMSLTGDPKGEPYLMGTFVIDYMTSVYCAYGILAALIAREKTGLGQHVECSLMNTAVSLLIDAIPEDILLHKRRTRIGNLDKCTAPVGAFKDANGEFIYIIAAPQKHWELLANIIGKPELITDERFSTVPIRHKNAIEVNKYVQDWVQQHSCDEILSIMDANGIPATKVLTVHDFIQLDQIKHNNQLISVKCGTKEIPMQGIPVAFSDTPSKIYYGSPKLGQDNQKILGELGFTADEIESLKKEGAI